MNKRTYGILSVPVLVAAMGYFVDIYDLLLFSIIRKQSLSSIGLSAEDILTQGEFILSVQMVGLLIGGILWGVLADKKGRLSVLFGSILLYSLANIANGFVNTVEQYAWLRFIAGIGLAGELGAGITLVAELLPKEKRGIGTSMVAGVGLTGAIVAYFISMEFDWRTCYFIGGGMGLLLLMLRVSVFESGMFRQIQEMKVKRGNFLSFFTSKERFYKYIKCILIGLPCWFVFGVLVSFSDKFAEELGITEIVSPGKAIMYAYIGLSLGDIAIGFVSQALRSRKKALYIFYCLTMIFLVLFFMQKGGDSDTMYILCAGLGFATGSWAIVITMAAEQFGTNLRATAATTVSNMVRGVLPLIILLFKYLREATDYITGGIIVAVIITIITWVAAIFTKETFGKDLNYVET